MMSGAANTIDEEWVEKKLKSANSSQDSVQSLSLWALNHKTQHEKIVGIWFKVLKTAKLDLRLTLFYLCNEVVQTCKRKHAIFFKDAFKEVLKDAALLVRDNSIRPNIERIFKIWGERHVYNKEFVDELMAILNNTKVKSTLSTRLLAEFKPDELMRKVRRMAEIEEEVELKRLQLSEQEWHSVDVESFKQQLKDRHECGQYVDQADECRMQLESYVTDLMQENRHRSVLIELLEQSELFYDAQNSEAAIVATAYKNFGSRVNTLHKKLCESRKPQKVSRTASVESEKASRSRKVQDPTATPTEDEFDDDSSDELIESTAQNCESSDDSFEKPAPRQDSVDERLSREGFRSPIASDDGVKTDVISSFGSLLSSLGAFTTPCFLPSVASHGPQPLELSNNIHGFAPSTFSSSAAPADDEDAGGATPVQDEEPNDESSSSLAPMEFLKQMIQDSTKSSAHHVTSGSDQSLPYPGHEMELASANQPQSTNAPWTAFDSGFSQPEGEHHAETVVYEGYEDGFEVMYHNPGPGQELSATTVYGPEGVQTYEVYAPAYVDHDTSRTYVVDAGSMEGYPCSADGYETVVEVYPPPPETEYQAAYQEQLMSGVVEDGVYGEVGDVYSVVQGENYQPQAVSGSYYGVVEHVQGIPAQPSVVYHPVQSYAQPPPAFRHPSLSLAPTQSFSHPPPSLSQPGSLAFIQPPSFTSPLPMNPPPPRLFTLPQNSNLPPPIPPPSFIEPLPPSPYRLLSPTSSKAPIRLPSPPVLAPPSSSSLESSSSNCLPLSPPFKPWNKKPYHPFRTDHGRGSVVSRDSGRFDGIAGTLDAYRMGRNFPKTRRTNLTYLTASEDRNGTSRIHDHLINSAAAADTKPRYPSTALRSMSLPCDAQIFNIQSTDQANGRQSVSPRSASSYGDASTKSQSSMSLSDSMTDHRLDRDDFGFDRGNKNLLTNPADEHHGNDSMVNNNGGESSIQLKQDAGKNSSPTRLTVSNIPSLGISSPRTLMPRNWSPRLRHVRPDLGVLRPLGSFRFRADFARRLQRKPHFVTQQMPFQRNF